MRETTRLQILSLIPPEGARLHSLLAQLNAGVPCWHFWRRWSRCRLFLALLAMEEDNLVFSQWSFFPFRRRVFKRSERGTILLWEATFGKSLHKARSR